MWKQCDEIYQLSLQLVSASRSFKVSLSSFFGPRSSNTENDTTYFPRIPKPDLRRHGNDDKHVLNVVKRSFGYGFGNTVKICTYVTNLRFNIISNLS